MESSGIWVPDDPGVPATLLNSSLTILLDSTTTSASGYYLFTVTPGTYAVMELVPLGYSITTPYLVRDVIVTGGNSVIVNFGLVQ